VTHGLIGDVVYGIICQQKLPLSAGGVPKGIGTSRRERERERARH
jgi:hypothetical protein